jgi:16S rRNA (uracil1498-N3)-methyltransferase
VWAAEVADLVHTQDAARLVAAADLAVVLHEAARGRLADLPIPSRGTVVVVVGPEGGLTDEELAAFETAGARTVRMGAEVLRTSTAGVAAAAALLSRTPRWG